MGRRKIEIDLTEAERLGGLGLTEAEIALALGISVATLERRKSDFEGFAEAIKKGKAKAGAIVANAIFQAAQDGNMTAAIWYEKTRRGLSEKSQLEVNGGVKIEVEYTNDWRTQAAE